MGGLYSAPSRYSLTLFVALGRLRLAIEGTGNFPSGLARCRPTIRKFISENPGKISASTKKSPQVKLATREKAS